MEIEVVQPVRNVVREENTRRFDPHAVFELDLNDDDSDEE